jgi:hypothetical protein
VFAFLDFLIISSLWWSYPALLHLLSNTRRLRRLSVRVRLSPFSVPFLLLFLWAGIISALAQVADTWIVILAVSPLFFAAVITALCLWAYRKDFYA